MLTAERSFFRILAARSLRGLAYGSLGVVVAISLAQRGYTAAQIGGFLSLTLASGAAFALASSSLARLFGDKATLIAGCALMALSGALFALTSSAPFLTLAFACGTLTAGGQDVGPFAAIEQAVIASYAKGTSSDRYALYNTVAIFFGAVGAGLVAIVSLHIILWFYALAAVLMALIYATLPYAPPPPAPTRTPVRRFGAIERLAALFAVDAMAGGFIVQAVIAYWFHLRYGTPLDTLGPLLAGANLLSAASFFAAAYLGKRIGLLNTMVFTHLPSNVLLVLIPFMPTFEWAATLLLARFALSQMDVPTRQAYVMAIAAPHDRIRAAGLTTAVRPAAAAIAPLIAGAAMQGAAFGAPFLIAGGLKIAYDLTLYFSCRGEEIPA